MICFENNPNLRPYMCGLKKNPFKQAKLDLWFLRWFLSRFLKNVLDQLFEAVTGLTVEKLSCYGDYFIQSKNKKLSNPFLKDVLHSRLLFQQKQIFEKMEEIISCNIWYDSKITVDGKTILYKTYFEKGIVFIQDLMNEYGHFMNYDTFRIKYNLKTTFLEYRILHRIIATNNIFIYN